MKDMMKPILAEFIASAFISFFALGMIVPTHLGYFDTFQFSIWFGFVYAVAIIIFGPVSGCFGNPASTIGCVTGGIADKKLILPYGIAQILGWAVGLVPIFPICNSTLNAYAAAGHNPVTLFFGNPSTEALLPTAITETIISAALCVMILMMFDKRLHHRPSKALFPFALGLGIAFLIAFSVGFTGGCGMNPARDLGPRIVCLIYGLINCYDVSAVFMNWNFVIYLVMPLTGGALGGLAYKYGMNYLLSKQKTATEGERETSEEAEEE